jgi:uncharacterized protein (TIGR00266 family)
MSPIREETGAPLGSAFMTQWYFDYGGNRSGPFDHAEAVARARKNPEGAVWRDGFPQWVAIRHVAELADGAAPAATVAGAPPRIAHEIDYRIVGGSMQFVEVELDPGEGAVAEAGAMMYKDPSIQMETLFGDGSQPSGGLLSKLAGAGKRLLTGESLFMTVFTHAGGGKAKVAFAAPFPGTIIPVMLPSVGGQLICQKDSFLCAARGVSISIFFQQKILTGLFGGEGFIMQKLEGDGLAFIHAGGTVVERQLARGESLHVDTGCVVAVEASVGFDVQRVGGVKTMLFGGEGVFFANLTGPGRVWLQSLPFSRLAGRMLAAGSRRGAEEGSVLGGIGLGALMGDD